MALFHTLKFCNKIGGGGGEYDTNVGGDGGTVNERDGIDSKLQIKCLTVNLIVSHLCNE